MALEYKSDNSTVEMEMLDSTDNNTNVSSFSTSYPSVYTNTPHKDHIMQINNVSEVDTFPSTTASKYLPINNSYTNMVVSERVSATSVSNCGLGFVDVAYNNHSINHLYEPETQLTRVHFAEDSMDQFVDVAYNNFHPQTPIKYDKRESNRDQKSECVSVKNGRNQCLTQSQMNATSQLCPNASDTTYSIDQFGGDELAMNIWMQCCDMTDRSIIMFDKLFIELLKVWKQKTKCERFPAKDEIKPIFLHFGGEICGMKQKYFVPFWSWFVNCCALIADIKYLWDSFELPLFCDKNCVNSLLNKDSTSVGTFVLRISRSLMGALVVSYVDSKTITIDSKTVMIKNIALKRDSQCRFTVHKNHTCQKPIHLMHLIRSFVKLKYIKIGNKTYAKHSIF